MAEHSGGREAVMRSFDDIVELIVQTISAVEVWSVETGRFGFCATLHANGQIHLTLHSSDNISSASSEKAID
jgi:hypothetical protein